MNICLECGESVTATAEQQSPCCQAGVDESHRCPYCDEEYWTNDQHCLHRAIGDRDDLRDRLAKLLAAVEPIVSYRFTVEGYPDWRNKLDKLAAVADAVRGG